MSLRPDGVYRCDRCGLQLENGGVQECAVISLMEPDTFSPIALHLCTAPRDGAPHGCQGNVLGPATLADYTESRSA